MAGLSFFGILKEKIFDKKWALLLVVTIAYLLSEVFVFNAWSFSPNEEYVRKEMQVGQGLKITRDQANLTLNDINTLVHNVYLEVRSPSYGAVQVNTAFLDLLTQSAWTVSTQKLVHPKGDLNYAYFHYMDRGEGLKSVNLNFTLPEHMSELYLSKLVINEAEPFTISKVRFTIFMVIILTIVLTGIEHYIPALSRVTGGPSLLIMYWWIIIGFLYALTISYVYYKGFKMGAPTTINGLDISRLIGILFILSINNVVVIPSLCIISYNTLMTKRDTILLSLGIGAVLFGSMTFYQQANMLFIDPAMGIISFGTITALLAMYLGNYAFTPGFGKIPIIRYFFIVFGLFLFPIVSFVMTPLAWMAIACAWPILHNWIFQPNSWKLKRNWLCYAALVSLALSVLISLFWFLDIMSLEALQTWPDQAKNFVPAQDVQFSLAHLSNVLYLDFFEALDTSRAFPYFAPSTAEVASTGTQVNLFDRISIFSIPIMWFYFLLLIRDKKQSMLLSSCCWVILAMALFYAYYSYFEFAVSAHILNPVYAPLVWGAFILMLKRMGNLTNSFHGVVLKGIAYFLLIKTIIIGALLPFANSHLTMSGYGLFMINPDFFISVQRAFEAWIY